MKSEREVKTDYSKNEELDMVEKGSNLVDKGV